MVRHVHSRVRVHVPELRTWVFYVILFSINQTLGVGFTLALEPEDQVEHKGGTGNEVVSLATDKPELPPGETGDPSVTKLEFGQKIKLEGLGPIIVNEDCTMRRIQSWSTLSTAEQQATIRIISKRNSKRLEICRSQERNDKTSLPDAAEVNIAGLPLEEWEDWDDEELKERRLEDMVHEDL